MLGSSFKGTKGTDVSGCDSDWEFETSDVGTSEAGVGTSEADVGTSEAGVVVAEEINVAENRDIGNVRERAWSAWNIMQTVRNNSAYCNNGPSGSCRRTNC